MPDPIAPAQELAMLTTAVSRMLTFREPAHRRAYVSMCRVVYGTDPAIYDEAIRVVLSVADEVPDLVTVEILEEAKRDDRLP